ncbi:MAG: KH domain-containing protein [Candidatus Berkelbacteria bacterium]|nr:KH domain-containing protein [Candidatus Berkelbacteria bacterium]
MAEYKDQAFVEMVVKQIVDNPNKVKTERRVDEMGVLIELTVDPEDMGKIIGKEGRTAKSIRTLLRVLGAKEHARVNMKIIEPEGSEAPKTEKPTVSAIKETKTAVKESATEEIMPIEEKSTGVI